MVQYTECIVGGYSQTKEPNNVYTVHKQQRYINGQKTYSATLYMVTDVSGGSHAIKLLLNPHSEHPCWAIRLCMTTASCQTATGVEAFKTNIKMMVI